MVIKKTDVKRLLQIPATDTAQDDAIDKFIEVLPEWLVGFCRQNFINPNLYRVANTFTFSGQTITDSLSGFLTAGFAGGMDIHIYGSQQNDGYYTIESVTADVLTVKDRHFNEEPEFWTVNLHQVIFPAGLQLPVASLFGYWLSKGKKQGVNSESIGDYSVSYSADMPQEILSMFKPFRRVKWL